MPRPGKQILVEVAEQRRISVAELISEKAYKYLVDARWEAIRRMRDELGYSFPQIGRLLRRDHSTIIYAYSAERRAKKRANYYRKRYGNEPA